MLDEFAKQTEEAGQLRSLVTTLTTITAKTKKLGSLEAWKLGNNFNNRRWEVGQLRSLATTLITKTAKAEKLRFWTDLQSKPKKLGSLEAW